MAAVRLEGVSKRFVLHHERPRSFQEMAIHLWHRRNNRNEELWAVRDVSFEVAEGETLGIIGRNGSGKSTIFKLVGRILRPTSGRIFVRGRLSALIELGAGFHPDLTGRENIYLNGSLLGLSRRDVAARFDAIVAFSELEPFLDMPLRHYSLGMYMRLGFAMAVHVEPDVLLVDEVLAVGDARFQERCLEAMAGFQRQGKAIVFVSHDTELVRRFCHRALFLSQGQVAALGEVAEVVRLYRDSLGLPSVAP